MFLGKHQIIEFHECDETILKCSKTIRDIFLKSAQMGNATIVESWFHNFSPYGVTGVLVIAESHISIHTWHEHKYCAVDIFSCSNNLDSETIIKNLKLKLKSNKTSIEEIKRGIINE